MFGRRKGSKSASSDGVAESAAPADDGAQEAVTQDAAASSADGGSGPSDADTAGAFRFDPSDGPFDKSAVPDIDAFYKSLGYGYFDLGSLVLGIPPNAQLNAALNPDGTPEFHVVDEVVRVIPRAFSAPRSGGLWREQLASIRQQLEAQGASTSHEDGPWGRELVAEQGGATLRMIGVEGPRWLLEARIVSTTEQAEAATESGRDILGRFVVSRGTSPMPSGEMLPMEIPAEIQESIAKARQQMAQQQAAAARAGQPGQPGQTPAAAQPAAGAQQPAQQSAQPAAQPAAQASARPAALTTDGSSPAAAGGASGKSTRKRASALDRLHEMDEEK